MLSKKRRRRREGSKINLTQPGMASQSVSCTLSQNRRSVSLSSGFLRIVSESAVSISRRGHSGAQVSHTWAERLSCQDNAELVGIIEVVGIKVEGIWAMVI